MTNLIIAYDLNKPGQYYDAVSAQIEGLGKWHKLQYSLYYVHTHMTAHEAYNHVAAVMDANDRLTVVNAIGAVVTESQHIIDELNKVWFSNAA